MTELNDADLPPLPIPTTVADLGEKAGVWHVYTHLFTEAQYREGQRQAIKDYLAKQEVRTTQKQFEGEVRSLIVKE